MNLAGNEQIGKSTAIELTNARFVDVVNGRFFEQGTRMIIKDGKIVAMPGLEGEENAIKPDFTFDLQGKSVLPGLFNVHCHIQLINSTIFADLKTLKAKRRCHTQQVEKSLADCIARGVTNIRDAFSDDLRMNCQLKERIENQEIPGPRIQQAVLVGPLGGYLTPELKGARKILLGLLGLGKVPYEGNQSGAIAFSPVADEKTIRAAVEQAIDERGADLIKIGESLEKSLLNKNPVTLSRHQLETITDQAVVDGNPFVQFFPILLECT